MKAFFVILFTFGAFAATAQKASDQYPGRRSFYAEVGGPGILFSANIDTRFKKSSLGLGGRAGVGFVTAWDNDVDPVNGFYNSKRVSVLTVPVQVNYVFGKPNSPHTFEVGAGFTVLGRRLDVFDNSYNDNEKSGFLGTAAFMYRRQPANGGFSWRIGFTPIITNGFIQPSGGVSVGYNF